MKAVALQVNPGDHTIVIGAGPAGLTAAYALSKAGHRVTVLEADGQVGGISRTAEYRGFRFDIGGHRFYTKVKRVAQLWDELLGDEFITVSRLSRIHYSGRFFAYPLKIGNALNGLGAISSARILLSYVWARMNPFPVEENFEQWVSNRFGRRLYEIFFKTYTEKVWGIPCTEIRAEWAAQRIQGLSLLRAVLTATSLNRRHVKSLIDSFRYPRLGPGQMWEAARDRVVAAGNDVLLNHRVAAVERVGDRVVAVEALTPTGTRRFNADHVISTTDLKSLVGMMEPSLPAPAGVGAAGLRYRDFLVVALILDRESVFPDNWIYVHTPGVKVGRIQNFNNWSQAMVPRPGCTCLGLEYFCFQGDGLWEASDPSLIALATAELRQLGIAPAANVVDGTVVRMPKAYPIYDAEYRGHLAAVREALAPIENLQTIGRNGMHKYNNQDHSMLAAMLAVDNMLGASNDLWAVNSDYEYLEEQSVEPATSRGSEV